MNRTSIARTLLIAGMAIAPFAFADSSIIKCIGNDGQVTLTDTACPSGERSVTLVAAATNSAPAAVEPATASLAAPATVTRTVGMVHARMPSRASVRPAGLAISRFDLPSRGLARDVATLKAARQAMMLMDGAAGAMRSRVAGLQ